MKYFQNKKDNTDFHIDMKDKKYLILFFIFLMTTFIGRTQEEVFRIERVTSEDGNLENVINTVFQDSKGFMWFGCENSLLRFDGYNVKSFKEDLNGDMVISGRVNTITEDGKGFLWIGTSIGLIRYDRRDNNVIKYQVNSKENTSIYVTRLIADSNYLYIATDKGIFKLNLQTQKVMPLEFLNDNELQSAYYADIMQDNDSILWLSTTDGLLKYNLKNYAYTEYKHQTGNINSLLENNCNICRRINNYLWIGHEKGITIFDTFNNTFKRISPSNNDTTQSIPIRIRSIFQDDDGDVYIGTINRGLYKYKPGQKIFYQYTNILNNPNSLSNDWVQCIYQDRFKVLWISTFGGGVNKIFTNKKKFYTLANNRLNQNSLANNHVFGITEDKSKNIWFATLGGVSKYNPDSKLFTNYVSVGTAFQNVPDIVNWVIYCDRSGNIWIGSESGLLKYNAQKDKIYRYQHPQTQKRINKTVYAISEDSKKNIWVGTRDGLYKFNPENNEFIEYQNIPGDSNSLSHNTVWRIVEDYDGFIWLATPQELNKFNPYTNKFTNYNKKANNQGWISFENISDILISRDSTIWTSTAGSGLFKYNKAQNDFIYYGEDFGFFSNVIYSMLEDKSANLWLSGNNGLVKFDPTTLGIKNYKEEQGLQGNEFNFAKLSSTSGLLYFGGTNGVSYFYPDSITEHTITPNVIISGIKIMNKEIQPGDTINNRILLKKPIEQTKEIDLIHKDKSITFTFAALHYAIPEKNLYRYKLERFDDEWNYSGNKRFATYTNLPAGKYTFMVEACNFDGVWNETPTILRVNIIPPFWKTWIFRISVIFIIISIIIVWIRLRIKDIEKQNKILEHNVKIRTEALYEANAQLKERQSDLEIKQEEILAQRDAIRMQNKELEKLSIAASKTENAITIMDSEGNFEWFNDAYKKLYGYNLEKFKKELGENIFTVNSNKNIKKIINSCIEKKISVNYESENISKTGKKIWTQVTITPILNADKKIVKLISIESDIGKLKKYEKEILNTNIELEQHRNNLDLLVKERTIELEKAKEKAEESDRLKSAFLANMSHEIRTPMNAIIGFSDLITDPEIEQEFKEDLSMRITQNCESLLRLIDDIIDTAKIESDQLKIEKSDFKISELFIELFSIFDQKRASLNKNLIELKISANNLQEDFTINSDKLRLKQVFTNLLDNALKFTEKGLIEFGFVPEKHKIKFFVKDTGIGLSEEQQKAIFQRFTKIEDNKTKLYRGAGLGLSISKNIIELLGGKIWVNSITGSGSSFQFTLPLQ